MNDCAFSPCGKYRYTLIHKWHESRPLVVWIGLNPSTADHARLDPTLLRIRNFSSQWGFGAFTMLNLFAYRTPHPKEMIALGTAAIGEFNDRWIRDVASQCKTVVACWGTNGDHLGRAAQVTDMLRAQGIQLHTLGFTQDKHPKHPLARGIHRIPNDARLMPYEH